MAGPTPTEESTKTKNNNKKQNNNKTPKEHTEGTGQATSPAERGEEVRPEQPIWGLKRGGSRGALY